MTYKELALMYYQKAVAEALAASKTNKHPVH